MAGFSVLLEGEWKANQIVKTFRPKGFDMKPRIGDTQEVGSVRQQVSGPVAQLGARFHGMEEVIGSIPIRSTN